jgi:hypothetical protein
MEKRRQRTRTEDIQRRVAQDLRKVRQLLGLIAREHGVEVPDVFAGSFTVAELLGFLEKHGEDPAAFFTLAFAL